MNYSYLKSWHDEALKRTGGRGQVLADLFLTPPVGENNLVVDLHSHDSSSDGRRSSRGSFQNASFNNVDVFATTNHDNINTQIGYYNYNVDTAKYRGQYINGVEVTCRLNGLPVEVLVYDYDFKKAKSLIENFEFPYLNRGFKLKRIVSLCEERLNKLNSLRVLDKPLDINDFISLEVPKKDGEPDYIPLKKCGLDARQCGLCTSKEVRESVNIEGVEYNVNYDNFISKLFKHIAVSEKGREFLAQNGVDVLEQYISKIDPTSPDMPDIYKEAFSKFNRFLVQAEGAPFNVSDANWWPTVEEVVEFAKKSGGVALFAHPYGYPNVKVDPEVLMQMAVDAGVDGIECMHGFNKAEQVEKIYQFCKKKGLLISAGSDTHTFVSNQGGKTEIGIIPGTGLNQNGEHDFIDGIVCSLHNVHLIGSGTYKEMQNQIEK